MAELATPAQPAVLEVDQAADTASESDYREELSTYSASLTSSVLDYRYTHGRRYHAYHSGSYQFPNDEEEQDRLDFFHHILVHLTCGGRLHFAPFQPDGARILDMGTGTGIWAIEMGDKYPNAEMILGNDLSPIQPSWVPPNVKFLVDDVESDWAHEKPFDYIHERYFAASIKDWPRLVRQCYDNLRPGGWVEFQETQNPVHCEDGSVTPDNYVFRMLNLIDEAIGERHINPGPHLEGWLKDAGFVNIHHEVFRLPIGTWPKDQKMKEIGAYMARMYLDGVDAFTNVPFTEVLKWSKTEVEVFNAKVRQDVLNKKYHAIHNFHVIWAQKPEN
ncbi:hypothetical protein VTN00DRAFT_3333 [Thermoascus crustaceus]|uniref:uncharacterized protein n=1 Tax=Thermoascus crustaceus TaxID=5088 RepID=UPI003742C33D